MISGYLRHRRAAGDTPRTLTVKVYQLEVFTRWLEGEVEGAPDVEHLTRRRLEDYLLFLRDEPSGRHGAARSASTARRYVGLIERVWAWAHDAAADHGAADVARPRSVTASLKREPEVWRESPTWVEMDAAIGQASGWLRPLLAVLRLTGLRVDQAMRLRRKDLDLDNADLRIRGELGKSTAEQSGRLIPVSRHLVALAARLDVDPDGWLLPCGRARRVPRHRDAAACWERAGVPERKWKGRPHHAFRAGFLSGLRSRGAPLDAIEVLVGHAPTATARSYLSRDAFDLRAVVDLVPALGCDPLRERDGA